MNQEKSASHLRIFLLATAVYLLTKWLFFKGFSGTDDLHYANLAANVLKGSYSPIVPGDIFSARAGLVYFQAIIYFIGGINAFTTQIATLVVTVLCCYLTVFKLGRLKDTGPVLVACSLFYFNPVLNVATLGILPDVFVMLTVIVIILLWKKVMVEKSKVQFFLLNLSIGCIILAGMFFKENVLIFVPLIICLGIWQKDKSGIKAAAIITATFITGVLICGLVYWHFTGDFLFRVHQIQNSTYLNPCNYALLPAKDLVVRLTYGVWWEFITTGFYPVILAAFILVFRLVAEKKFKSNIPFDAACFIILLLLGLYFPFSLKGYQPLCFNARHFIFLYPFGILIATRFIQDAFEKNGLLTKYLLSVSLLLLLCAFIGTNNKWHWMMYGLFSAYFLLLAFSKNNPLLFRTRHAGFALLLWLYMPYQLFFQNSNWFKDSQTISAQLPGNYFYFPEHENMISWKLLHHFDTAYHCYNLDPAPFKLFVPYYEKQDSVFHPGWVIINHGFTARTPGFLEKIKHPDSQQYFPIQKQVGDIRAYYLSDKTQYEFMQALTARDSNNDSGCCN
ncbi:MAG: hypothetical protein V4722_19955 [Bacteroidota bacterium]